MRRAAAKPPTKWIRSSTGTPARIVTTKWRDHRGERLYRLHFGDVVGHQLWTLPQLVQAGVRFVKIKPRGWQNRRAK